MWLTLSAGSSEERTQFAVAVTGGCHPKPLLPLTGRRLILVPCLPSPLNDLGGSNWLLIVAVSVPLLLARWKSL